MKVKKMTFTEINLMSKYHTMVTIGLVSDVQAPIQFLAKGFEIMGAFELDQIDFKICF